MKTILVIDHDEKLREDLRVFLLSEKYDVLTADDSLTGLHQTLIHLPDLIVCDVTMPWIDGYDFYKTLQKNKSTSDIPVIFLTPKGDHKKARIGMDLGADDYIPKPFEFDDLLVSIKTRFRKIEQLQQKDKDSFSAFIDNPLTGVFVYSRDKFELVNEKCAKIFGLSQSDLSCMSFENLVEGNDKEVVLEKIQHFFSNSQNSLHLKFKARYHGNNHHVDIEMFARSIKFKGMDVLAGYIAECA